MPHRCIICGTDGATCGPPTTDILPVDAPITGVRVAGNTVVPILPTAPPDMTDEEKEEYQMMVAARTKKSLRTQLEEARVRAMANGSVAHTYLVYVDRGDGITTKMTQEEADAYVEHNPGSSIVRKGELEPPKEGEVIGATKASAGEMFDENGRQKEGVQSLTTRTFNANQRTSHEVLNPAVGTTGTGTSENMTGTGSNSTSAVTPKVTKPSGSGKND